MKDAAKSKKLTKDAEGKIGKPYSRHERKVRKDSYERYGKDLPHEGDHEVMMRRTEKVFKHDKAKGRHVSKAKKHQSKANKAQAERVAARPKTILRKRRKAANEHIAALRDLL